MRGNIVLLVTPFDTEHELDVDSYRRLLQFVMAEGVDGLLPLGTTGEFFSLSTEEKHRIIDITVEEVAGRLPVCVGVGHSGSRESAELARYAEARGADAVLLPPPYYYPLADASIARHFTAVASAVTIPVMVYDGGGGVSVPLPVLAEVNRACPNISLIKESVLDAGKVAAIRDLLGDRASVFCGDEVMLLPELACGAVGMATAAGNVLPKVSSEICALFLAGRRDEARELYDRHLAPWIVVSGVAKHEFVRCFKEVLAEKGVIDCPATRLPLGELHPTRRTELIAAARRVGILS